MVDRIAGWWDALELWIAGVPFIPQVVLVLAVVGPLAFGIAWTLDRALRAALQRGDRSASTTSEYEVQ